MVDSILNTIKKLLNIPPNDTAFDVEILVHINSVFMMLNQLGIGPETVYQINGSTEKWSDFLGEDETKYNAVKSLMYLKVRLMFDPPGTPFLISSMEAQISEMVFRLTTQAYIAPVE